MRFSQENLKVNYVLVYCWKEHTKKKATLLYIYYSLNKIPTDCRSQNNEFELFGERIQGHTYSSCVNERKHKRKKYIPKGNDGCMAKTLYQVTPHFYLTFATNILAH